MLSIIILCIINLLPTKTITTNPETTQRPNITFILGEDEDDNQYYDLAKQYYLTNKNYQNYIYVDSCRSLLAVRNCLENYLPEGATAWGNINIVVHSNQWTGLSVPVTEGGERTTLETLYDSMQETTFEPLPDTILDNLSQMDFKACGLGANKDLLYALQIAFGGFDRLQPQVKSSEDFIYYGADEQQQVQSKSFKPYYAFYKTAFKPADLHLQKQLKQRYPDTKIDWMTAMNNKQARWDGDVFYCKFNVPIEWYVLLDKDVDLDSKAAQLAFVKTQSDLIAKLNEFNIPIEKFRWTLKTETKDGQRYVKIKGKSTVLCILAES